MRGNFLSLVGLGFFLLAIWQALRVRRDLASCQTRWETALFGRGTPIFRAEAPMKYWCAIVVNTAVVFLLALVAAAAFRITALSKL